MVGLHYPIWSIWTQLGSLHRLFWLFLSLASVYMLFSIARIWVRLRGRIAPREGGTISSSRRSLAAMEDRLRNVRQFVNAAFYLFWLLFFIQLPYDIWTTDPGRLSIGMAMWGTLSLEFTFGANVFVVLLSLHSAQWLVCARVSSARQHLSE